MGVPPMNAKNTDGQDARDTDGRDDRATHGRDAHATKTPYGVTTNEFEQQMTNVGCAPHTFFCECM